MSERIVVIGGAGMIGSYVVKELLTLGHKAVIFDNLSAYPFNQLKFYGLDGLKNLRVIKGDIRDKNQVNNVIKKCDKVVHLASLADVGACIRNPELNFRVDIDGTFNVVQSCLKNKIKKLVFASSASVYGSPEWKNDEPPMVTENDALRPTTPYANTKLFNEQQLRLCYELYGLPATSLRYFSVYGKFQMPKKGSHSWAIAIFTMLAMKNKPIKIFGDGNQIRDLTHVSEIAQATTNSLVNPETDGQIFNVGTGIPTTINKMADEIEKSIGQIKREYIPLVKGDPKGCYADNRLMKKLLGWTPRVRLEDGIEEYVRWVKDNQKVIPKWI